MATARDYITSSLKEIGVLGEQETPTAAQSADGLEALNDLIDQWAAIRLQIYSITVRRCRSSEATSASLPGWRATPC